MQGKLQQAVAQHAYETHEDMKGPKVQLRKLGFKGGVVVAREQQKR